MTVTLAFVDATATVTVDATALAAADVALVERSTNQVRWTTVRGATAVPVTAGVMDQVTDYEFTPGVANYYRVRGVETPAVTFVAAGVAATGVNASVVPALPAGLVVGDAMVCLASIRNSGTGTVTTPAGWTLITASGNVSLFGRRYQSGDTAPTVAFAGGAAGADTLAQIAAWRRADITPLTVNSQLNSSAQNIATPAASLFDDGAVAIVAGWKQDDWTSVAALAGAAEIAETTSVAGDDAGQVWDYTIQTTATDVAADTLTVTGGASAISRGLLAVLPHAGYLNEQTANLTPALTGTWLKSCTRPFLNQLLQLGGDRLAWTRRSRGDTIDITGRTLPMAVTDLRSGRSGTITARTTTSAEQQNLDYLLASGDVIVWQGSGVPGGIMWIQAGDIVERTVRNGGDIRVWTIPATEVAAPSADIAYAQSTWETVLAVYATWDDLLAANPTWADVIALVGDPSEVIVP